MTDVIETARRHDEAFNSKDADSRLAIEAPDIDVVLPGGIALRGPEQHLAFVRVFWEALPDATITVDNQFAAEEAVVAEGTLIGTHSGTFRAPHGEIPSSGNSVRLRYASVKEIRDGKVASEHLYFDQLEFLQQIGAMPSGS